MEKITGIALFLLGIVFAVVPLYLISVEDSFFVLPLVILIWLWTVLLLKSAVIILRGDRRVEFPKRKLMVGLVLGVTIILFLGMFLSSRNILFSVFISLGYTILPLYLSVRLPSHFSSQDGWSSSNFLTTFLCLLVLIYILLGYLY